MRTSSPIPFPSPGAPPSPESSRRAAAELSESFRNELAWAVVEEGEPSYEELEAAVNGTLEPEAAERLSLRADADPVLAAEIADLTRLRDRLRPARPGIAASRTLRIAGLAAALLLALVGLDRGLGRAPNPAPAGELSAAHPASQPLYADGFESGDASGWAQ